MPTLTFDIPNSEWARLEEMRKQEGLRSVRELIKWRLRQTFDLPSPPYRPGLNLPEAEVEAAA